MNFISQDKIASQMAGVSRYAPTLLDAKPSISKRSYEKLNVQVELALDRLSSISKIALTSGFLIHNFIRSEVFYSCLLAGGSLDFMEVLSAEAGLLSEIGNEVKQAMNCLSAYYFVKENLRGLNRSQLSISLLRDTHQKLINSAPGSKNQGGVIRHAFVDKYSWADDLAPPSLDSLPRLLKNLDELLKKKPDSMPPFVHIAMICANFKIIHPFNNGNRRMGRLLIFALMKEWRLIPESVLFLSKYFFINRIDYDHLLRNVYYKNDWEPWIIFFLKGVLYSAESSEKNIVQITNLINMHRHKLLQSDSTSFTVLQLFELIKINPYINVDRVCQELKISFPSANSAIATLVSLGILKEITLKKRNRYFSYQALIDLSL